MTDDELCTLLTAAGVYVGRRPWWAVGPVWRVVGKRRARRQLALLAGTFTDEADR